MSTIAVIEESPRSVSVMETGHSAVFQTRTGMFFKKVSQFRNGRRKSEDRKSSGLYTRASRSVDLSNMGNKAFGISQPVLGVNTEHSSLDNEDPSDPSPTVAGSPTCTAPPKAKPADPPKSTPNPVQPKPVNSTPNVDATPRATTPCGLPAESHIPSHNQLDGLPPIDDASWCLLEGNTPAIAVPSDRSQSESTTSAASSVTVTPAVGSGMADSNSHDSAQTFHSAIEEHTMSPPQPSGEAAATGFSDRAALTSTPPLIDHPLPDEPTSPPWKFNPSPRNPFVTFDSSTPVARTMSLPSRNLLSPNTTPMPTPALPDPVTPTVASPATPRSPSLHPRLASLPPPMMHRYATQGSVRMTPSMGFRPTPMPIMNLPTLPLPTPRTPPLEAVTQSPARLRTMPALPLRGPSEVEEADHENAGLDEMEDVDEMDEEEGDGDDDMEMEMPEEHANDDDESPQEVEVPTMGHRLRSPLPPSLSRSPGLQQLPQVDTSPLNITWRRSPDAVVERPNTQYFTPSDPIPPVDILTTPMPAFRKGAAPPGVDYFTSKSPEAHVATPDVTRTPRPGDIDFVPRTVPMPSATPRPGLYQQGSKSMINLLSMSRKQEQNDEEVSATENRISRAPDYFIATTRDIPQPVAGPSGAVDAATQMTKSPTLRRQRSLPMYTTATEPPPYPAFPPHAGPVVIEPRDEEGREQLPPYSNSIYLVAVMPRKMEFTAPGFQSKDRKWKRALCVLEGTAFRVYRVHSGVVEDWWERTVGVGDRTRIDPFTVGTAGTIRVSGLRATERAREQREPPPRHKEDSSPSQDDIDASETTASTSAPIPPCQPKPPASRSRLHLAASLLHPSRSSKPGESSGGMRSRLSFDVPRDAPRSSAASTPRRSSIDSSCTPSASTSPSTSPSSRIHRNNSSDTSPSSSSIQPSSSAAASRPASVTPATSHFGSTTSSCSLEQVPDPKDLLRSYSLQHAESGLASDYTKRKNVIRVRMEGEQFLLQAKDVPGVIEWIEGIQAATNIALDLDERPMPKGPIFPRRRRRRARRTDAQSGNNAGSSSTARSSQPR